MKQKETVKILLAAIAIIFMVLPLVVTFSSALTSLFNKVGWYVALQSHVVPFEAKLVAVLLRVVGIKAIITPNSTFAMLLEKKEGFLPVEIQWNCLGWQSLIMLILTLFTGLRGNWKIVTKLQTAILGVLGTFLVNILRMALITAFGYWVNNGAAMIIHDYFATLVAILWLFFFWWFSYSFVLETRDNEGL